MIVTAPAHPVEAFGEAWHLIQVNKQDTSRGMTLDFTGNDLNVNS